MRAGVLDQLSPGVVDPLWTARESFGFLDAVRKQGQFGMDASTGFEIKRAASVVDTQNVVARGLRNMAVGRVPARVLTEAARASSGTWLANFGAGSLVDPGNPRGIYRRLWIGGAVRTVLARPAMFRLPNLLPAETALVRQFNRMASSLFQPCVEQLLGSILAPYRLLSQPGLDFITKMGRVAEQFAWRMFLALVEAQHAVVIGDLDAVARFFARWTDVPATRRSVRMWAGSDVLLDVDIDQWGPENAFELLEWIERETNRRFCRGRRMLGEPRLNHHRVLSLEDARTRLGDEIFEGVMPWGPSAEDKALEALNQLDSERLKALLGSA
jgi:hypothetical protein